MHFVRAHFGDPDERDAFPRWPSALLAIFRKVAYGGVAWEVPAAQVPILKFGTTLFADVPNLSIENATKMSKYRKLWSSNRPSLRCQPLRK